MTFLSTPVATSRCNGRFKTAEYIHGETGINGIDVFEPQTPLQDRAWQPTSSSRRCWSAEDDSITLVPTGPLTNIGTVIDREPAILPKIERIVLMGGAMREGGNRTPSAEFNILVDPDAADIVFRCGRPITQMGLDVTHQVLSTDERVERIRGIWTIRLRSRHCGDDRFFRTLRHEQILSAPVRTAA